jgi:hypothetical protein
MPVEDHLQFPWCFPEGMPQPKSAAKFEQTSTEWPFATNFLSLRCTETTASYAVYSIIINVGGGVLARLTVVKEDPLW